jgi:YidC/Oxa1 family membrane protein insertase
MVQQVLELFHVSLDLPWYGSIILYTIILRTCLLPLTIKLQRSSANMRVFAPQMQELNQKMMDARTKGNQLESNFELKLI